MDCHKLSFRPLQVVDSSSTYTLTVSSEGPGSASVVVTELVSERSFIHGLEYHRPRSSDSTHKRKKYDDFLTQLDHKFSSAEIRSMWILGSQCSAAKVQTTKSQYATPHTNS